MADWGLEDVTLGGQSLKTYGYGLRILGGLDVAPGKRGSDLSVAYARGLFWRPKRFDTVTRTLVMWVDGRESDGTYLPTRSQRRARCNANIRELMAIIATETEQLVITREVLLPSGTETWSGLCEVQSPVVFDGDDDFDAIRGGTCDLIFADPLWYGPLQTDVITGSGTVNNPGEVASNNAVITLSGGADYVLENTTLGITLTVASSGTIVVDCGAATVYSGVTNIIGRATVAGDRDFMRLAPGSNAIELNSGSASIAFNPPRL